MYFADGVVPNGPLVKLNGSVRKILKLYAQQLDTKIKRPLDTGSP